MRYQTNACTHRAEAPILSSPQRTTSGLGRGLGREQRPGLRHTLDLAAHIAGCRIDLPELAVDGARGVEPLAIRTEADAVNRFSIENSETDPQCGRIDSNESRLANGEQRPTVG